MIHGPLARMVRTLLALVFTLALGLPALAQQRLGDIATFSGVRANALIGYGLIVGLNGTGDQTSQTPFTNQALRNMLAQLGVTVEGGKSMQLKNIAAVMVTAELPAFAAPGQRLDVTVSSMGNAGSLTGGTLLLTPLKGVDGQIYALAQGNVLAPGLNIKAAGSSVQINQTATGRINGGATIERAAPAELARDGVIELELKDADFTTATRAAQAINQAFGSATASAINSRLISITMPEGTPSAVAFMASIQDLRVQRGTPPPRVVFNSRTGSVVINGQVTLDAAAVAHGSLSVTITSNPIVSQPAPFSAGQTVVVPQAEIKVKQEGGSLNPVAASTSLQQVINALNQLGATPVDLMAILEALKAAGALKAELEVI